VIAAALKSVTKRFGSLVALDRVDLELGRGEVLALLGPNAAGKTTALSVLLGLRRPDGGRGAVRIGPAASRFTSGRRSDSTGEQLSTDGARP
jgi:ABC-2 type transport system ATP-binding protein